MRYFLLLLPLLSCSKKIEPPPYKAKVEVQVAIESTIPIGLKAVGHCCAYNSVEIKAQIEGLLEEIYYKEGGAVSKDDLLAVIDPRPFLATLDKNLAIRAENMAHLKYAAEVVERYQTLVPKEYVSQLEFDGFVKDYQIYEATVMQNDADVALAQLNVDYCYIKAPFSGVAGKKLIDKGNLITNDAPILVVINQIDPIYIDFSLPEKDFKTIMKYKKGATALTVDIQIPNEKNQKASLILVDNSINTQTGMVPLRAEISNPENLFWPGQYVEATLILKEEENALLIPSKAISTGRDGFYVFIVNSEGKAEYKPITPYGIYGNYTHIKGDIKKGDKVVTRGQINVTPNGLCEIISKESAE
jgi:multidrug efflux system membrane fusion protein